MTNEQKQVTEFMALFGQEIKTKPEMPSEEIRLLRAKLIFEEAIETIHALGCDVHHSQRGVFLDSEIHATLTDIADGLADLHYVAYCGTAAACGINMEPVFAEVHQSNMTKLWTDAEAAVAAIPGGVRRRLRCRSFGLARCRSRRESGGREAVVPAITATGTAVPQSPRFRGA
jgi:predicted HAD superfamily Cof-like phosphohydrolase